MMGKVRVQFGVFSFLTVILLSQVFAVLPTRAAGASLTFTPNRGDFIVDSTFEVSLLVNTGGQSINAVEALVNFPADKLQVVSLSKSIIEIWVAQPSFSNTKGTISLQGGIPTPGINTSAGSLITVTFRAKSAGTATLRFGESKILANDGNGTNILSSKGEANYNLTLPPPSGPVVTSFTHEDQNKWYNNPEISLSWTAPQGAVEYSYIFDDQPTTVPDDTAETKNLSTVIKADRDGVLYFHIKAKSTVWGGTTHFPVKIDSKAPAAFTPEIDPEVFTANNKGVAKFQTTDSTSGIDHYEVRIINLADQDGNATVFTEESSPYLISEQKSGKYKLVVRAYDRAGNYTEGTKEFRVSSPAIALMLGRPFLSGAALLATLLTLVLLFVLWRRHKREQNKVKEIQGHITTIQEQIANRQAEIASLSTTQQYLQQQIGQPLPPTPPTVPPNNLAQGLDPRQNFPAQ